MVKAGGSLASKPARPAVQSLSFGWKRVSLTLRCSLWWRTAAATAEIPILP
jgi:hypothetical protein